MSDIKEISPETISQTEAHIAYGLAHMAFDDNYGTNDQSKPVLVRCANLILESSHELGETVSDYNKYLNNLAEAFKNMDQQMAEKIGGRPYFTSSPTGSETIYQGMEVEEVRNTDLYNYLLDD